MDITVVACPGPPPVRAWMVVKFCRDVITELIIKKNVVGEIIGKMCIRDRRKEHPYLSGGVEIAGSIASAVILNVF